MKRGHALLALTLAAAPAPARAQTIDRSNGEAGAPILQLTTTPRAAALGGALAAAAGVTSIFANPAGAVTVQHFEAQLAGQTLFEGSKAGSMALGVRRHAVGLALGIRYLDLGSVDEVVCNACGGRGTPTGQRLSAADYAAVRGAPGRVGGGIEAGVADPATQLLAVVRLGYLSRAGGDFDQRPLTLGLGLRFHQVSLDYAYQGSEVLSSQHRLGLTFTGR